MNLLLFVTISKILDLYILSIIGFNLINNYYNKLLLHIIEKLIY